ncbi:WD40 repeat domain-containing protein [Rubripirellula amarantea]|nr:WD40 repeat domain-containing protein [Rubripirellula amarantea]
MKTARGRWIATLTALAFAVAAMPAGLLAQTPSAKDIRPESLFPRSSSVQKAVPRSSLAIRQGDDAKKDVPSRTVKFRSEAGEPVTVTAIAVDPMSDAVAVAGDDHVIRIIDSTSLQTIEELTGHRDRIRTLSFHPENGRLVSAGNDGQLIIWDSKQDYAIRQRMEGTPAIARVRYSTDGNEIAAVGFDSEVFLIGKRVSDRPRLTCDCRDLRAIAYRDDQAMFVVAGRSGDLHLFDTKTTTLIGEFPIHKGRVDDVVFAPQSNIAISVGEDGRLVTFDTRTKEVIKRVSITSGKLFAATMLNSHWVAVAGSDNVIRVVNIDTGNVVAILEGHRGSVPTLAASGGYLFSGGFDATLRRWAVVDMEPTDERIAEGDSPEQRQ